MSVGAIIGAGITTNVIKKIYVGGTNMAKRRKKKKRR